MKRILLFGVVSVCTLCGFAQNNGSLYLRNDSLANRIATDIAQDERYKSVSKVSLEVAIKEAFGSYWKDTKYPLKVKQQALLTKWNELKAQLGSLQNEEARLKANLRPTNQQDLEEMEYWRKKCEKARQDCIRMQGVLDSQKKEFEDKTNKWEKFKQSDDYQAFQDADIVKKIDVAEAECAKKFSEMGCDVMKNAVGSFDESKDAIKSLMEAEPFAELSGKVEKIRKYISLYEKTQEAIKQMAGKFNNQKNTNLMNGLKADKKASGLPDHQKKEYNEICTALYIQENAFINLKDMIDDILRDLNARGNANIANVIRYRQDELSRGSRYSNFTQDEHGKTIYNRYYIHFNKVLNELRTTTLTGRELKNRLTELKRTL